MKRFIAIICVFLSLLTLPSCAFAEKAPPIEPKVSQMKAICELAVMDCYYHNVAEYYEEDAQTGWLVIDKDKKFWIEYSGIVTLGIDVSLVTLEISDNVVTIAVPPGKVLDCKVDSSSLTKDSYIVAKKSADVTAYDETAAFSEAQKHLRETVENDTALLASAQQRAMSLLDEYITNISNAVGKQYTINWIYLDAAGNPISIGTRVDPATIESSSAEE